MSTPSDLDIVTTHTNYFLDSMPPRSRIIFPDLVLSVKDSLKLFTNVNVSDKNLLNVIRDIVSNRPDLIVMRGIGIYKSAK